METAIKLYKELCYIQTTDWELIPIAEDLKTMKMIYADKNQFIDLWTELLSKRMIKRIFSKKVDEIDNMIVMINDKNLRARVQAEVDERRRNWKRLNKEILDNIISRLWQ